MTQGQQAFTGDRLLDGYTKAIQDMETLGSPEAATAVQGFDHALAEISMRQDEYGRQAAKARGAFNTYLQQRLNGAPPSNPASFLESETRGLLSNYLVEDGTQESRRLVAAVGDPQRRAQTQVFEDGSVGFEVNGHIQLLPMQEFMQPHVREVILQAARGEPAYSQMPGAMQQTVGQAAAGAPLLTKVADITQRGIVAALDPAVDFEDLPPELDVPTADPTFRFRRLPHFAEALGYDDPNGRVSAEMLRDPVVTRTIQEVLADASARGDLDPTVLGTFSSTIGFLADFWAGGTAVKGALGAAKLGTAVAGAAAGEALPVQALWGRSIKAMAETSRLGSAVKTAAGAPAIRLGWHTVTDFASYEMLKGAVYGDIKSPSDALRSGMVGAKEGLFMYGMGSLAGFARSGLGRALTRVAKDGSVSYRLGPVGEIIGGLRTKSLEASGPSSISRFTDKIVEEIAKRGKTSDGLRRSLIENGLEHSMAQTIEHAIDGAMLGSAFGAYQDAVSDPEYQNMDPMAKTARFIQGLASPESLGSAMAFAAWPVTQHASNRIAWGKNWERAPENVKRDLEVRLMQAAREIAQPGSHELANAFREAFDHFSKTDPEAFKGLEFRDRWQQDLARAMRLQPEEATTLEFPGAMLEPTGEEPPPESLGGPDVSPNTPPPAPPSAPPQPALPFSPTGGAAPAAPAPASAAPAQAAPVAPGPQQARKAPVAKPAGQVQPEAQPAPPAGQPEPSPRARFLDELNNPEAANKRRRKVKAVAPPKPKTAEELLKEIPPVPTIEELESLDRTARELNEAIAERNAAKGKGKKPKGFASTGGYRGPVGESWQRTKAEELAAEAKRRGLKVYLPNESPRGSVYLTVEDAQGQQYDLRMSEHEPVYYNEKARAKVGNKVTKDDAAANVLDRLGTGTEETVDEWGQTVPATGMRPRKEKLTGVAEHGAGSAPPEEPNVNWAKAGAAKLRAALTEAGVPTAEEAAKKKAEALTPQEKNWQGGVDAQAEAEFQGKVFRGEAYGEQAEAAARRLGVASIPKKLPAGDARARAIDTWVSALQALLGCTKEAARKAIDARWRWARSEFKSLEGANNEMVFEAVASGLASEMSESGAVDLMGWRKHAKVPVNEPRKGPPPTEADFPLGGDYGADTESYPPDKLFQAAGERVGDEVDVGVPLDAVQVARGETPRETARGMASLFMDMVAERLGLKSRDLRATHEGDAAVVTIRLPRERVTERTRALEREAIEGGAPTLDLSEVRVRFGHGEAPGGGKKTGLLETTDAPGWGDKAIDLNGSDADVARHMEYLLQKLERKTPETLFQGEGLGQSVSGKPTKTELGVSSATPAGRMTRQLFVDSLIQHFGLSPDEVEAVMATADVAADTWAKRRGKTREDWYGESVGGVEGPPAGLSPAALKNNRGMVEFITDGRAMIHALTKPNVSTILHEMSHIWRRQLDAKDLATVEKWAGVKNGVWERASEEKFSHGAEQYFMRGKAPTPELKRVFEQFRGWFKQIYKNIRGSGLDVKVPRDVRDVFDSIFRLKPLAEDEIVQKRISLMSQADVADLYAKNRNEPQYVGMSGPDVVGHLLRGGLPSIERTTPVKLAQAGDSAKQVWEILSGAGVAIGLPQRHPTVASWTNDLANGGNEVLRHRFEVLGQGEAYDLAISVAKRAREQTREAMLAVERDHLKPGETSRLDPLFRYQDLARGNAPVPEELKRELEKADLWDKKHDTLHIGAQRAVDAAATERIRSSLLDPNKAIPDHIAQATRGLYRFVAYSTSPHVFQESWFSRNVKLKVAMDRLHKNKLIPVGMDRALQRMGLVVGNVWSNNPIGSMDAATLKSGYVDVFAPRQAESHMWNVMAADILHRWSARNGYRVPPRSETELFNWLISTGAVKRMKGPEDVEALRAGAGHLYELANDAIDLMGQMGQAAYREGYLTKEQLDKWLGHYIPYMALRVDQAEFDAEIREGRMPNAMAGRNMSRLPEGKAGLPRIEHPFYWLTTLAAQEAKPIELMGSLQDLLHGGYAVSENTLAKMDPYSANMYEPVTIDAQLEGKSFWGGPARRLHEILKPMLDEQLDPNNKRAKSETLQRMLQAYLNRKPGERLYLPRHFLFELDNIVQQMSNPPDLQTLFGRAMYRYEQATRLYRRGLTVGRPKHWVLNMTSSVGTNHLRDVVPMWDFATSVLVGKGYYADAARDLLGMLDLAKVRQEQGLARDAKPADWSVEKWDRVKMLEREFQILNGSTFTGVGLEMNILGEPLAAISEPDVVSWQIQRDLEEAGHPIDSSMASRVAVFDAARRAHNGAIELDRMLFRGMGSHDPAERARAVQHLQTHYALWEMFYAHAGVLRMADTQPGGMGLEQMVRIAKSGSADYLNTSPVLRSFNSSLSVVGNPLYIKTEPGYARAIRAVTREALKGRFWMYESTMKVPKLTSVVTSPIRAATIYAIGAGMASALTQLSASDPDEEAAYQEAYKNAMLVAGHPILEGPALEAAAGQAPIGAANGAAAFRDEDRGLLNSIWKRMLAGKELIFPAPTRGGDTRMSDIRDISAGWGDWLDLSESVKLAGKMSAEERAQAYLDALSLRGMELATAAAHGFFGAGKLASNWNDPDARFEALKGTRDAMQSIFPTFGPLWHLGRDGNRLFEVAALNGQSFDEWARGMIQVEQPSVGANAGEFLFSSLLKSQRVVQPRMAGGERSAMDALLQRLVPTSNPSQGEAWDLYKAAQSKVHYQLSEILSGTYEEWLKWGHTVPQLTYDSMLVPAVLGDNGPMTRMIAQQDPATRTRMETYLKNFVTSQAWREMLGPMVAITGTREMRPDYFRQAVTNALRDPDGGALMNWIYERVVTNKPRPRDLQNLATVFVKAVKAPESSSDARYIAWAEIWSSLLKAGYQPVAMPDNVTQALRDLGLKPELQGGRALRQAIIAR